MSDYMGVPTTAGCVCPLPTISCPIRSAPPLRSSTFPASPMSDDGSRFLAAVVVLPLPSIHALLLALKVLHLDVRIAVPIHEAMEEDVEHPVASAGVGVSGATCSFHVSLIIISAWARSANAVYDCELRHSDSLVLLMASRVFPQ